MALSAVRLGTPAQATSGATVTLYTVPAGKRSILRDVRLAKTTGTAALLELAVTPAAGTGSTVALIREVSAPVDKTWKEQDAFIVLNAGDAVTLHSANGNVKGYLSGHEFTVA